jgi:MFS family permease
MKNIDPRETLDKAPMSLLQMIVVGITCVLNGLDGFDVLSISFASPGIAAEWGIDRATLGIVLSMELIGMAIGSIVIGGVADKIGRRKTSLGCMMVMAIGMLLTTTVSSLVQLSVYRIFTGFGLGGLLAAINALAAEFANRKRRHLCVSIMSIGYPIGGVIGGLIAAQLLASYSWRSVFYFGAGITAIFIPVVFFLVPESVHWLVRKQPKDALKKANAALIRMGHKPVDALPEVAPEARKKSMKDLFSPGLAGITTIVTAAYFLHITTYYFILKWVPKVVADMGFAVSSAGNVLVCANIGGAVGGAIFGFLTLRFDLKKLTVGVMAFGALFIALFGLVPSMLGNIGIPLNSVPALFGGAEVDHLYTYLGLFAFLCGITGNTAIVGMFALFAHAFPTHVRASGTGFGVGIGRGGAILSPIIVGFLFQWGFSLPVVTALISIGGFIGAAVLLFLKLNEEQ